MGLDDFEPIFGEAKAEWSAPNSPPLRPFLFGVRVLGSSCLRVHVTDFHSNTFEAVRSVEQLEDMRDMIGIGGSWSEFIDYVVASIKSDDVKLILEGHSRPDGAAYAKLIAQKSKGMPLISISLAKLVDAAASDAMANLSLELHKAFQSMQNFLINEQERCCQLTKVISVEQEKNEIIQRQLDTILYSKRQKSLKMNDKPNSGALSVTGLQDSAGEFHPVAIPTHSLNRLVAQNPGSTKVTKRVVPAYRRSKVRGVLLHDADDGDN